MADIFSNLISRPAPGDEPGADSLSGAQHHIPGDQGDIEARAQGHHDPAYQAAFSTHEGEGTSAASAEPSVHGVHHANTETSATPQDTQLGHHHQTNIDHVAADQEEGHSHHEPHHHPHHHEHA